MWLFGAWMVCSWCKVSFHETASLYTYIIIQDHHFFNKRFVLHTKLKIASLKTEVALQFI
jgi:hypothetical protein